MAINGPGNEGSGWEEKVPVLLTFQQPTTRIINFQKYNKSWKKNYKRERGKNNKTGCFRT